jgi:DNA-binding response OmpR family regulator
MSAAKHKTILIVDDDRDAADALAKFIQSEGLQVLIAYDQMGLDLAGAIIARYYFSRCGTAR